MHDLNENCGNCKFWDGARDKTEGLGLCHRYPPKPAGIVPQRQMMTGEVIPNVLHAIPTTNMDSWCGEFSKYIELKLNA